MGNKHPQGIQRPPTGPQPCGFCCDCCHCKAQTLALADSDVQKANCSLGNPGSLPSVAIQPRPHCVTPKFVGTLVSTGLSHWQPCAHTRLCSDGRQQLLDYVFITLCFSFLLYLPSFLKNLFVFVSEPTCKTWCVPHPCKMPEVRGFSPLELKLKVVVIWCGFGKLNPGPLQELQVLLTTDPSLQPPILCFS